MLEYIYRSLSLVCLLVYAAPAFAVIAGVGPLPGISSSSRYLQYYGNDFSPANIARMAQYDVVVLSPNVPGITPKVVADLQAQGVRYVLGYISIGEESDLVPIVGAANGDPYTSGPVSLDPYTKSIISKNAGFASYYVDDEWNAASSSYISDNVPDINVNFHGRFVNPDALWRNIIDTQRRGGSAAMPSRTGLAGLAQIAGARVNDLDTNPTHNFGFDGFFLDTLDTSGPFENIWGYYAWTAPAMQQTVQFIAQKYPSKFILANRGVFFYNHKLINTRANIRPYDYNIRPWVNAIMYESHTLDSNPTADLSVYFTDNVYNFAPKVDAEANRPDGFTVFALDYAMGRNSVLLDFAYRQAVVENGWTEYIADDGALNTPGAYTLGVTAPADTRAPVWDSIDGVSSWPQMDVPDRIGIQDLQPGPTAADIIVYWDVARDQSLPVKYNIYYSTDPLFATFTKLAAVPFVSGHDAYTDPTAGYANKFTVSGLTPGTRYYFRVRAEDSAPTIHEDTNTVTMSMVAGSAGRDNALANPVTATAITVDGYTSDWAGLNSFGSDPNDVPDYAGQVDLRSIVMADDYSNLYVTLRNDAPIGSLNWGYSIYLDTDNNPGTGYRGALGSLSIGAEYMIQGSFLYFYQGTGMDWLWGPPVPLTTAVNGANAEYQIPKLQLGDPGVFKLIFYGDNAVNAYPVDIDLFPDQAMTAGQALTYQANAAVSSGQVDLIAPELTVPADVPVTGTGALTPVTLLPAVAYDQVDGYVQVYNNAPSLFPVGTTIVNYTAVDNSGNVASGRQLVTVVSGASASPGSSPSFGASGGGGGCLIQTGEGNGWFLALMFLCLLSAINYFRSSDEHRRVE